MSRRWVIATAALGTLAVLVAVRSWAINQVESALTQRGVTWQSRTTAPLGAHWYGLQSSQGSAQRLSIRGTWPISVQIRSPEVDLAQWMDAQPTSNTAPQSLRPPVSVAVDGLTVRWGERILMQDLSGPILPTPDLRGPQSTLKLERDAQGKRVAIGTGVVPLDLPGLKGTAQVGIRASDTISATLEIPDAVITHPMIAKESLPAQALSVSLTWNRSTDALTMTGALSDVAFSAEGTATVGPVKTNLTVQIPKTDLTHVVAVFGSAIPEASRARFQGDLGMSATVVGPPWKVDPTPEVSELGVRGALPSGFRSRMVQWTARDSNGNPVLKQTGPVHPDWTSLADAGWVPMAIVAAEDGSFNTHPGYDLGAIREAISQARTGERLRGGSTLTQQLAKNLFLSGERTLLRKLRELVLALELEAALSKPAILALYLNVVEFGPGIHGIQAAADAYFLKKPSGLTLTEAAWLASVLPGPSAAHARARAGKARRARVRTILDRMAARGTISGTQRDHAKAAPLRFVVE